MNFAAPSIQGERVRVDPFDPAADTDVLYDLDWARANDPVMAGWVRHSGGPGTVIVRDAALPRTDPEATVGVIDAAELTGYPGVANVSIYTDATRARGGLALEAYWLVVDAMFTQGARIIHHEVLEFNRPIQRAMRAMGLTATARYREHCYTAGRWWDVLVYSFDEAAWHALLARVPRNPLRKSRPPEP